MQGKNHLAGGAVALLLASVLLAGCANGSAVSAQSSPTTGAQPAPTTSTQPSPTATATPQPSATPVITVHGDWQTYIDTKYGFHLDVPAILTYTFPAVSTSGPDDSYISWQYDSAKGTPPSGQALYAEITVDVHATDTLTDGNPNPCTIGRRIPIGSG